MAYADKTVSLKKVTFTRWGDSPEMSIQETYAGTCVVRIGNLEAVVAQQDLLSAALFVGAKHMEIKIK